MPQPGESDLLNLLHDAARLVRTSADRRARAHGMTWAQCMTLFRLRRHDDLTQAALADLLEVEPITAGRLVDRLEARGLVERRHDPADRCVWRLHLTPAAAPVLAAIDEARRAFHAEATQGLAEAERRAAVAALAKMKSNLLAAGSLPGEAA